MTEITFREPAPTAIAAKRGRPEKFTAAIQAALTARPGEFAVIREGLKSASGATALRKRYPAFEFVTERHADGTLNILARAVKPEPKQRKRAPKPEQTPETPAAE